MMFFNLLRPERGKYKRIFTALLFAACSIIPQLGVGNEQAATETEIKAIESDIQHAKELLESLNAAQTSAREQVQKNERAIQQLNSDISTLETRLKEGQGEIKKLQSRQQVLTAKSEQQKVQVVQSLQSLYKSLGDNRIKLLLNQEDPETVSRQLVYLDYFQKAQLQSIQEYEKTLVELQSVEKTRQTLITRLNQEKTVIDQKKQSLVKQQSERKKRLSELASRYRKGGKELKQLEQEREKLDQMLASIISRQLSNSDSFNSRKGKLLWPVKGRVLFQFNDQNPETRMRWQGMFIATAAGTTVNAVHDGRVLFADWLSSYGLLVIVDHGDDFLTLYAHNNFILRQEGDTVLAGEPLALSGYSGGQQNEGVYFEVRLNGKPQNPSLWLGRE
ncbi:murein hydrolase activator EnvC [Endozoicomonas sp. SCSIO W0465]|uniref:murein hydrolase activator EnvC family protein n=1 Tax=Endozoicomonas sp. SCSIO W0465 TaxID=2918516 RepID=UPI002074B2BF|nr:peptidoglycan DD-metalloendopeptidase family protein [Endozoicomonas sp. SCSIO W0465]USE37028.1 peptidoglycan DD-metalloendopeptidase family protein [Endozoicomonas sp. SCSIO W0465]